ncbi:MAG TPA: FkbM family methyltransferase [Methylocella sp.]|nr:FkbM family methyltransferase [Methylocella sp.]
MTVVDVGANIGLYTCFLVQEIGSTGRVHAFEPAQQNFSRLEDAVCAAFRSAKAFQRE